MSGSFADYLKEAIKDAENYETCMSLYVSREGNCVTLLTDTSRDTYSRWIEGIVGGDCGLIIDRETEEVIGIKLEVKDMKLVVSHDGPLRINAGFRKDDAR